MDLLHETDTRRSYHETQYGQNSANLAGPLSLSQPSSSRASEPDGDGQPTHICDRTTPAPILYQLFRREAFPTLSESNPHSGFFAGASQIDASHGIFTDIAGGLHFNVETKRDNLFLLNQLPRALNSGYRAEHHRKCSPGTRNAELLRIEKWELDFTDKRVYWLNGMAGCGKSTIAQTFAERSSVGGRLGASFFCCRDFPDRRNTHLIFPTLAFVLAYRYSQFQEALLEAMTSSPDAAHESLAVQLETLLIRPLKSTNLSTTIVIDALDECEDNEPTSAILSLLARHIDVIPSVKFFITGRPELHIRTAFRLPLLRPRTEVFVLHEVKPSSVDQDIERFLRTRLSEIVASRSRWDLSVPWPADDDIIALIKRCSGFFIVAHIITKDIGDPHLDPKEQLKAITSEADSTLREGESGVDETYRQVFLRSFAGMDRSNTEYFGLLRLVVGSIVLILNPLSCVALAEMLGIQPESVWKAIRLLHSVLMVPESDTQPLRICHKSFADFITNRDRCMDDRFYIESSVLHMDLGMRCLRLMDVSLKKNICDLSPYDMNEDIFDRDARRENHIRDGLDYACRSWAKHLRSASTDGTNVGHIVGLLERFFKYHLLSWLEVLSIAGDMRCAVYSLRDVRVWFVDVGSPNTNLLDIMKDSERFILRYFDAIGASAYHVYHTALSWSPKASLVRALYHDQLSTEVKMLNAIDDSWDACVREVQTRNSALSIAFSHNDDFIAVGEKFLVEVFQNLTGQRLATFTLTEAVSNWSLAFSPDDSLLVTGRNDGILDIWALQTGVHVGSLRGHTRDVHSVAFSPCGTMIASGSNDRTIRIWDVISRECRSLEGHSNPVQCICWSATGEEIVSGSWDRTVKVWNVIRMICVMTFSGNADEVRSVACSPDLSFIASGSKYEVRLFNAQTGDVVRWIQTDGWVNSIRFLGQDMLVYATHRSTFEILDLTESTDTLIPASKNVLKCSFLKVQIQPKVSQSQKCRSRTFKFQGVGAAISSGGKLIVSENSKVVKIWQADGTSQSHDTASLSNSVYIVTFSGDGRLIVSVASNNTVKLWKANTGQCLERFTHSRQVTSVILSSDSTRLASGTDDRTIRIWDTLTRDLISTLNTRGIPKSLGFSPGGNQLVSAGSSEGVMDLDLWEVATGRRLASREVDMSSKKVSFSVDDASVILESKNSVVRWKICPIQSTTDDNNNGRSSLPMEFVPSHDIQQPVAPRLCYPRGSEWILDEKRRRVLWVPPDMRDRCSDSHGKKVAFGSQSGKVVILDFSDVKY